eukprot:777541-Ditylum_brightwellii.AAC.1
MAEFSEMILKDYRVKKRSITVRNPQANNIIERIHQTIGIMIRDATLNVKHEAEWNYIKQRRESLIRKNNEQEDKKRKTHNYQVGDKVLLKGDRATKYESNAYSGSYPIKQVNSNGTVKIKMTLNMRRYTVYPHNN